MFLRARPLHDGVEARVALDSNELPYPVIVDTGMVYDRQSWRFNRLDYGLPIKLVRFQS